MDKVRTVEPHICDISCQVHIGNFTTGHMQQPAEQIHRIECISKSMLLRQSVIWRKDDDFDLTVKDEVYSSRCISNIGRVIVRGCKSK